MSRGTDAIDLGTMYVICAAVLLALPAAAGMDIPTTGSAAVPEHKVEFPEDLGPSEIDVSGYPEEHRRTYREVFIPTFEALGGTARVVNSPVIELDPARQEAERRANPALFSDPRLALVGADGWKKKVQEIRLRPPCCGACPVLSLKDARSLWRFLAYDSIARKTGPKAESWLRLRKSLLERFQQL